MAQESALETIQREFPDQPVWNEQMRARWWELVEGEYPYQAKLALGRTNPKALEESGLAKGDFIYYPKEDNTSLWGFKLPEDAKAFRDKYGATEL